VFGLIRFHDDLSCPPAVTCGDHPPAFLYVRPEARRVFEHLSDVQLGELDQPGAAHWARAAP